MNFLEGNSFVSGGRWRCRVCEKFLFWQELEHCGYTARLLREFADIASPQHDRIEITSDGNYRLLDESKQRHGNKRKAAEEEEPDPVVSSRSGRPEQKKSKPNENEIIIL